MAVKLRLTRTDCKKRPFYRVVAINSTTRRDGAPLEFLGYYNPMVNPAKVEIDTQRVKHWLDKGAEASDTVRNLLKQLGK